MKTNPDPTLKTPRDVRAYEFREVDGIDPLELVGNARLALHHHMAPAGSLEESELDDELS